MSRLNRILVERYAEHYARVNPTIAPLVPIIVAIETAATTTRQDGANNKQEATLGRPLAIESDRRGGRI